MRSRFFIKDILSPLRRLLSKLPERDVMIILSLFVGICCGLAAVLLKMSIEFIHHGLTSWFDNEAYNFLFLIYPGIGMLIAMLFVKYVVKDNIGHGVTKVLVAVSKNDSKIKKHNMWSSMIASSVTIGFGGSVGAEAPIVYTGAAIGSNVARYMGLSYKNMTILLGCGAAGAVAGIFKAPLAGVLFTLEILLFNISMSSILPLLLSTISATVVSYILLGDKPPFECTISPFALENLPYYVLLGLFCAACSVYFTRMTLWLEDKIKSIQKPLVRWGISASCLGLLIFLFPPLFGEGYGYLHELLNGGTIDMEGQTLQPYSPLKEYEKHNRELLRVWGYLRKKGQKQVFEKSLFNAMEYFVPLATQVTEEWKLIEEGRKDMPERGSLNPAICHGDYQYHNILKNAQGWHIVNFEKIQGDNSFLILL